jgi:hypothetical protein
VNPLFRDVVVARIRGALQESAALNRISHQGMKGHIREILLRDLFRPLFPSDIGAGTGKVIASHGEESSEVDVVVFDRRILPPITYEGSVGLFLIESVLYAIEVKTKLWPADIRSAHENAKLLFSIKDRYLSGWHDADDAPIQQPVNLLVPALFALASSSATPEGARYDSVRGEEDPSIRAFCVVGKGYWDWSELGEWRRWGDDGEYSEVVHFIGHVFNSLSKIAQSRGFPRLGNYLLS